MTKKILLICMVASLCGTGPGCRFLRRLSQGGCNYDYCCTYGPRYTPFVAVYPDGTKRKGTIGLNDVGTFDRRSPGGTTYQCSQILVMQGTNFGFALTASPSSADLNAAPASVTISGQAFDATYGMPLVEYFDNLGYLIGSVTATEVAADGSWVIAPTPDLSSVYSGTYEVRVTNLRSDGEYLNIVGSATLSCWGRDRPDSDGDGYYDDQDCYPFDPNLWDCSGGGGGGGGCGTSYCEVY